MLVLTVHGFGDLKLQSIVKISGGFDEPRKNSSEKSFVLVFIVWHSNAFVEEQIDGSEVRESEFAVHQERLKRRNQSAKARR